MTGVVACLASSTKKGLFACWGEEPRAPEGPSPSPRKVVSSYGLGEGPDSSPTDLNRDTSITSSPLMVINGTICCWSSLATPHRTPCLVQNASAQAFNALARGNVLSWWMTQEFCGSEAGGKVLWAKTL